MRAEKKLLLEEIKSYLKAAPAFVLMGYHKMDPNITADFRNDVAETGGGFYVVKKRIFLKAANELGIALKKEMLEGHLGFVYSGEDTVSIAKTVYKYKKSHEDMITILGGSFEGKICSSEDVKAISELSNKNEMRAQVLGVLEAPMSEMISLIEALLTSVIHCIDQKMEKDAQSS